MPRTPRKKIIIGLLAVMAAALLATPALASHFIGYEKIKRADSLLNKLDQGLEWVDVLVMQAQGQKLEALVHASPEEALKARQAKVKSLQDKLLSVMSEDRFELRRRFANAPIMSARVTRGGLESLAAIESVSVIQENRRIEFTTRQGVPQMKPGALRSQYGGQGVAIAIVDTGIDYNHPALGGGGFPNAKVLGGYDFGDFDPDPNDSSAKAGHGTACAGIAAGDNTNVGDFIGGVAPRAKLYALRIANVEGALEGDGYAAWDWCISHKNDDPGNPILIISNSWGVPMSYFSSYCDLADPIGAAMARKVTDNGIALFQSSGNEGMCGSISSPSCLSEVISVGAVYDADIGSIGICTRWDSCVSTIEPRCPFRGACDDATTAQDQVTCYSSTGGILDLLAPSNNAYTTYPTHKGSYTAKFGGTSAACPYAAGAAAVLQSWAKAALNRYLTPDELKARLVSSGDPLDDPKSGITKPRVNITAAIGAASPTQVTEFVTRFYVQCLNRQPDEGGLKYWVDSLVSGERAGADVARGFINSEEFQNRNLGDPDFMRVLYRAFFDREPDEGGLADYLSRLASGVSRSDVLESFINSEEFTNLCERYGIRPR